MKKFKEFDLTENLQEFQEKTSIEIEFEKGINGKIKLENATVKYDEKNGYINIDGKNVSFKINTTLVYRYENDEGVINISLESFLLKIRKI